MGLVVSENESLTIMVGIIAGRHGTRTVAESSGLIHKQEAEMGILGMV